MRIGFQQKSRTDFPDVMSGRESDRSSRGEVKTCWREQLLNTLRDSPYHEAMITNGEGRATRDRMSFGPAMGEGEW
jgi:hypothetical protein